ncbi:MAG TPA: hypothetical protein VKP65_11885 [Rhodothermales bacterium]|nr:hypothetical protein [Rhodothermales bacterium]
MLAPSDSVPVKIQLNDEDYMQEDLYEASGLLKYRDQALVLEYRTSGIDLVKSDVSVATIPLHEVRSVDLKKRLFSTQIIIGVNSLSVLDDMPGGEGHALTLKVPWKERKHASSFVAFLRAELSEMKLS